jgi:hypothetical protein
MTVGEKTNLLSAHTPYIHGVDTEMKLKSPWNSLLGYWNQSRVSFKNDKTAYACIAHVNFFKFFFNY